jgi:hypothetical protein
MDLNGSGILKTPIGKDKFREENTVKIAWKHDISEIKAPKTPKPLRSLKSKKPTNED